MATPKAQRIGIWIITVVMVVGVIGSFAVMILSTQNQASDQSKQAQQQAALVQQAQQQTAQLSSKYYPTLSQYQSTPTQFDPTTVGSTVTTQDLLAGTGDMITSTTNYQAYYIGWNPDGKTFDSSFADGQSLKAPLDTGALAAQGGGLIKGWNQGVQGMKVGGIREVTIPAPLAYGSSSPSSDIPPNTPLKFIIYIIQKD